jgi:integrase
MNESRSIPRVEVDRSSYRPELPQPVWREVEGFVKATIEGVSGKTAYASADLSLVTTRLAVWAVTTAGLDLDRRTLFNRHVIARFVRVGLPEYNEAARGNLRSQLLRIAESLLDPRDVPLRLAPMKAADPSRPFSRKDVVVLRSWAETQSTPNRRTNARVLLALGLGAGLSAVEIGTLTVDAIAVSRAGVTLQIGGGRQRVVPVLREWEEPLRARRSQLADGRFAFRERHSANYDNLISNFVARGKSVEVVPQSQRMRATWIVHHLDRGTPIVSLARAAGVESFEAFTRYLRFVEPPADDWLDRLR